MTFIHLLAKAKAAKPTLKKSTPAKAGPAQRGDRERIPAKANLKKYPSKKAAPKADLKNASEEDSKAQRNTLGPKVSKSKAGKKRSLSELTEKPKKKLPVDSSEDELENGGVYSDSSLGIEPFLNIY